MSRCPSDWAIRLVAGLCFVACSDGADPRPPGPSSDTGGTMDASPVDSGHPVDGGVEEADAGFATDSGAVPDAGGMMFSGPVVVDVDAPQPPATLSGFNFVRHVGEGRFAYNDRVVPYTLNTTLFSDFSEKARAIYVPPGEAIAFTADGAFDMPVGSAVIKTFMVQDDLSDGDRADVRLVETRVLVRYADQWRPLPYIWRDDGSDADLVYGGRTKTFPLVDPYGQARTSEYLIPSRNQCFECHELLDAEDEAFTTLIGPQARYLDRDGQYNGETVNQLTFLAAQGMLTGLPDLAEIEPAVDLRGLVPSSTQSMSAAQITRASRDYLDINCAHCHRRDAVKGVTSQLFLEHDSEDQFRLGVCKQPGSAATGTGGRPFNIVPGDPDRSILVYRMETEVVGEMMPLIGRSLADDLGVSLMRAWVAQMPPDDCR